jgi:hypothetical protein
MQRVLPGPATMEPSAAGPLWQPYESASRCKIPLPAQPPARPRHRQPGCERPPVVLWGGGKAAIKGRTRNNVTRIAGAASLRTRSVGAGSEEQINQSTVFHAPTCGVPRDRGVRGAARGLERDLKASGRHTRKHNSTNSS